MKLGNITGHAEREHERETKADFKFEDVFTLKNVTGVALSIGGGYAGSYLGAAIGTGIGFMGFGPVGAVVGFNAGNLAGWVGGAVGGSKIAPAIADAFGESAEKSFIKDAEASMYSKKKSKVGIEKTNKERN